MDDRIRQRMKQALEMKKLDPYEVSLAAGFNKNYLWESFNPKRRKGSLDGYKKIADNIGLSYFWLLEEKGQPFVLTEEEIIAVDQGSIEEIVDTLLELLSEFQSCGKDQRILRLKLQLAILEFLRKENR
jgi:hypothetical protein